MNCVPHPLKLVSGSGASSGYLSFKPSPDVPAAKTNAAGQPTTCDTSTTITITESATSEPDQENGPQVEGKFYYSVNGDASYGYCGVSYYSPGGGLSSPWTENLIWENNKKVLYCDIINGNTVRFMCPNYPFADGCPSKN